MSLSLVLPASATPQTPHFDTLHVTIITPTDRTVDRGDLCDIFFSQTGLRKLSFHEGYAFAHFQTPQDAARVLKSVQDGDFGPRCLRLQVEFARISYRPNYYHPDILHSPNRRLHVTHFPRNTTVLELKKIFGRYQGFEVVEYHIKYAYVTYHTESNSNRAMLDLNERTNLIVSFAKPDIRDDVCISPPPADLPLPNFRSSAGLNNRAISSTHSRFTTQQQMLFSGYAAVKSPPVHPLSSRPRAFSDGPPRENGSYRAPYEQILAHQSQKNQELIQTVHTTSMVAINQNTFGFSLQGGAGANRDDIDRLDVSTMSLALQDLYPVNYAMRKPPIPKSSSGYRRSPTPVPEFQEFRPRDLHEISPYARHNSHPVSSMSRAKSWGGQPTAFERELRDMPTRNSVVGYPTASDYLRHDLSLGASSALLSRQAEEGKIRSAMSPSPDPHQTTQALRSFGPPAAMSQSFITFDDLPTGNAAFETKAAAKNPTSTHVPPMLQELIHEVPHSQSSGSPLLRFPNLVASPTSADSPPHTGSRRYSNSEAIPPAEGGRMEDFAGGWSLWTGQAPW
ncbi:hypothetical protein M427DRAFT_59909 [Gonapodya prolifera JEL478]|uniref:RRM domain-containing protein n=1 Tax=Gonapodya prolifera (strain JEL478) TaxID=1344416 RepID=A0A139A5X1_GONPJ|nr:hypothetical protein M427DRAFT_59909 [Gonapodya prolifera JEL478]|eukprot:KXS12049.1 hypothetical protein M427DRAFT_59909 [Gonapodya prolifera JEL478]